jgi:hypothetical protein
MFIFINFMHDSRIFEGHSFRQFSESSSSGPDPKPLIVVRGGTGPDLAQARTPTTGTIHAMIDSQQNNKQHEKA